MYSPNSSHEEGPGSVFAELVYLSVSSSFSCKGEEKAAVGVRSVCYNLLSSALLHTQLQDPAVEGD